jgi:hypothetical protein
MNDSESPAKLIIQCIANAETSVASEFERTRNSWLACFGSVIFCLEIYVSLRAFKLCVGEEQCDAAVAMLEDIKSRHWQLKQQYDDAAPPEAEQRLLFASLDGLKCLAMSIDKS